MMTWTQFWVLMAFPFALWGVLFYIFHWRLKKTNHGSLIQLHNPKMPEQMEFNLTRKCPEHPNAELIRFHLGEIAVRACTQCGSLYLSDQGLDLVKERIQKINDELLSERVYIDHKKVI